MRGYHNDRLPPPLPHGSGLMRFTAAIACLVVFLDCAEKAVGSVPQTVFNDGSLWIWWFPAASFLFAGVSIAIRGAD